MNISTLDRDATVGDRDLTLLLIELQTLRNKPVLYQDVVPREDGTSSYVFETTADKVGLGLLRMTVKSKLALGNYLARELASKNNTVFTYDPAVGQDEQTMGLYVTKRGVGNDTHFHLSPARLR